VLALRRLVVDAQHVVALLAKLVVVRRQIHLLPMRRAPAQPTRGRCPCPAPSAMISSACALRTIRCSVLAGRIRIAAAMDASPFQLVRVPPPLRVSRAGLRAEAPNRQCCRGRRDRCGAHPSASAFIAGNAAARGPAASPTWTRHISPPVAVRLEAKISRSWRWALDR
jgi:hypothetical protein